MGYKGSCGFLRGLTHFDKFAFSHFLVLFLRALVQAFDFILDLFFGYTLMNGWRSERVKSKNYENSAQIVNIWFKGVLSIAINHKLSNFLYKHEKYVHPRYILENDNVTLFGITKTHAFFCVTDPKNPDHDILDNSKTPFMFVIQLIQSQKLVIIPHETLHRLAGEIGNPDDREVTVLDMTGRCGSTLICQMMARLPTCRALSECYAFNACNRMYSDGEIPYAKFRILIRSMFRILCKPENNKKITHILIKQSPMCISFQGIIKECFPKVKTMFVTRQLKKCVLSYMKLRDSLPPFYINTKYSHDFLIGSLPIPYDDPEWWDIRSEWLKRGNPDNHDLCFTVTCAATFAYYQKYKDTFDHAIIYEDFMANNVEQTKKLFTKMNLSHDYVDEALKALQKDSQQGIFGQRGGLDKIGITDERWKEIDQVFKECKSDIRTNMSLDDLRKIVY